MYLKNMEVKLPDEKLLEIMKDVPVPMGLLQYQWRMLCYMALVIGSRVPGN
jgi:hypothetical protein